MNLLNVMNVPYVKVGLIERHNSSLVRYENTRDHTMCNDKNMINHRRR